MSGVCRAAAGGDAVFVEVEVGFTHSITASSAAFASCQGLLSTHVWGTVGYPHGHSTIPTGVAADFRAVREKLPVLLQSGHIDWCDAVKGRQTTCKILIFSSDGTRAFT